MDNEFRGGAGILPDKPSAARIYDYLLGGFHNFAIDRDAAERVRRIYPDMPQVMQANRAFLRRAVTFFAVQGIDQFLDIGSGIPTVGNVHEVAHRLNPAARVAYVDIDPVAVDHSRALLEGDLRATVVQADARQPLEILDHPDIRRLLDFDRPIGVLLVALLHFITDDAHAFGLVRTLRDALAPGSYLALTHATADAMPPDVAAQIRQLYDGTANPGTYRTRVEIERLFDGFALVAPGTVYVSRWRPEAVDDLFIDEPERSVYFAGVGMKSPSGE